MNFNIKKKEADIFIKLMLIIIGFICVAGIATIDKFGIIIGIVFFFLIILFPIQRTLKRNEMTIVLIIPIMMSALQNVYLGYFSPYLSKMAVQILTVLNFMFVVILFCLLVVRKNRVSYREKNNILFVMLVLYSLFSVVLLPNFNILSIISSFRNIISIYLFYYIGFMTAKELNMKSYQNMLLVLGVIVVIIGIIDVMTHGKMWLLLNITELWGKKGIHVQASGLPTNFYSSEKINGERIRRMASTFADPVHLGSFLFSMYCIAWYRKEKLLKILFFVSIFLTVSKGAMLGLLILACVYALYYFSKPSFIMICIFTGLMGIMFLVYAYKTSSNSVFAHISGLFAAFESVLHNPLGSGVGSNGVLAAQFSGFYANEAITETGIGMIIGQLGVPGFVIFVCFFSNLIFSSFKIQDIREKVFCLALTLSIIANMFFNEVALSPNSSGIYFIFIGYYISKSRMKYGDTLYENINK